MTTAASTAYCGIFQLQQQQQQEPSMLASGDFPPAPDVPPTSQEEQHQQETPTGSSKLDPATRQHHRYPRQQHPNGSKKKQQQQPGADSNGGGNPGLSCELCNAKCTGEAMYQDHLKGAKHAKKLKAQQFEAQSSAKDPAVYCEVCNLTLHPELMVGHRSGLRHRKAAGEVTKPGGGGQQQHRYYNKQPKKAAQAAAAANNEAADASKNSSGCDQQKQQAASAADAEAQKQQQQELQMSALSKEELLKIVAKRLNMECSVCRVQFSVFANAEVHFNSRAHRAAYQKFQRDQIRSKGHVCEACDVAVNSQDLFDAHLKGYRHAVREHGGYLPEGHQFYEKYKKHQETMMSYRRKLFA